jgi:hypothetical protein
LWTPSAAPQLQITSAYRRIQLNLPFSGFGKIAHAVFLRLTLVQQNEQK